MVLPEKSQRRKFGGESVRATYIRDLLRNGAPIKAVAQQVGNRSLASIARYAPKLTPAQILKQYKAAFPRA
jgi:site-specific recombinase XerD